MIVKDTVEERILDLQDRKRELANVTIEGKSAAGKLTMNDMMALFGRDAESRFTGERGNIDLTQTTRLLNSSNDESTAPQEVSYASQGKNRRPESRVPPTESSVYGRRW